MWEPSKTFGFEAAHSLERAVDTGPSRRIHGHSYRVEVTVRRSSDPKTGMAFDFRLFERSLVATLDGLRVPARPAVR